MPTKKQAPKTSHRRERFAVYFRPRKWRGNWILQQLGSSFAELHDVGRGIEDRYPRGEHAMFVIPPHGAAPEHFADGDEPGRLRYQTTCEWATFGRRRLQSRIAT